jgi:hypothetical protein
MRLRTFAFLITFLFVSEIMAQEKPKLFINCQRARCFDTYLLTELSYFTFTRDQAQADIQILITDQGNAGGGRNYNLNFIGQQALKGQGKVVEFTTEQNDTESTARAKVLKNISQGLLYFVGNTDIAKDMVISFPKGQPIANKDIGEKDKWNNWIFGLGGSGRFDGESNKKEVRFDGNFRGGRTTEKSKFSYYTYINQKTNSVTLKNKVETAKVNSYGFNMLYVSNFAKKWSVGGLMKGYHSIYSNIDFSGSLAPAIEFSIFPIEDFNKEQFRWIYQAGYRRLDYLERTIFNKTLETKPYHQVTSILGYTKPWGNFSAELNGYQYLDDPDKFRVSMELELSWRILQGVNLRLYGIGSQIRNQISLARTASSNEEILLGGQQLPTSFDYYTSFGLNFTFGSVNSSIVNPRFSGVN